MAVQKVTTRYNDPRTYEIPSSHPFIIVSILPHLYNHCLLSFRAIHNYSLLSLLSLEVSIPSTGHSSYLPYGLRRKLRKDKQRNPGRRKEKKRQAKKRGKRMALPDSSPSQLLSPLYAENLLAAGLIGPVSPDGTRRVHKRRLYPFSDKEYVDIPLCDVNTRKQAPQSLCRNSQRPHIRGHSTISRLRCRLCIILVEPVVQQASWLSCSGGG